jgi:putative ABC transport system substrate-binding protein
MERRRFFAALGVGIVARPLAAQALQAPKLYRVGWVFLMSPGEEPRSLVDAFRDGLRQHGYVEGQNLAFEFRWSDGRADRVDELTGELVKLGVDLIVAGTSQNAHAAQRATATIPILLVGADPLSTGLVTNLARPGANITGVTILPGPSVAGKYVELVKEAVPSISRVAIVWNEDSPLQPVMLREARSAASTLGLKLQAVGFRRADEFDRAFGTVAAKGAAAVVLPDAVTFAHRRRLAELALSHRLPTLFGHSETAVAGGLMGYGANLTAIVRHAATHAHKIFRGARPGDLPVEQPTKFELVINLKTAKALGLTIPPSLLLRADQVIQ